MFPWLPCREDAVLDDRGRGGGASHTGAVAVPAVSERGHLLPPSVTGHSGLSGLALLAVLTVTETKCNSDSDLRRQRISLAQLPGCESSHVFMDVVHLHSQQL